MEAHTYQCLRHDKELNADVTMNFLKTASAMRSYMASGKISSPNPDTCSTLRSAFISPFGNEFLIAFTGLCREASRPQRGRQPAPFQSERVWAQANETKLILGLQYSCLIATQHRRGQLPSQFYYHRKRRKDRGT